MDPLQQPGIRLVTVFLADATFRHREDALMTANPPKADAASGTAQIEVEVRDVKEKSAMVVILRVSSDPEDATSRYDFDVRVVGVFEPMLGVPNMEINHFAVANGGGLLYPFAREAVANLTGRGRFGPVWLNPFNIHAIVSAGAQEASQVAPPNQVPVPAKRSGGKTSRAKN